MATNLDISGHTSMQMITAVVYKKLNDLLVSKNKKELFAFVKSVKIRGSNLSIKTEKPIVNSELAMFKSEIEDIFVSSCAIFGISLSEIKISFR